MSQTILLLFYTSLNMSLSSSDLHQLIPHQVCMYNLLPEVQPEVDYCLDLPGLVGAQFLSQDHMGEDKGYLGFPLPIEHPLPLCSQDCSKPSPHFPLGRGVPAI